MNLLKWNPDDSTERWTRKLLVSPMVEVAPQFAGKYLNSSTWERYILADEFPGHCFASNHRLLCSPNNIIRCFREERMIEGLALVIAWGGMVRTQQKIYPTSHLPFETTLLSVEELLHRCAESIVKNDSIEGAWKLLKNDLDWTDTLSSKTLHFLSRSLGYEQNPGVAIDGKVILDKFAYHYDDQVRRLGGNPQELGVWRNNGTPKQSWLAYNRYMTAICCWAEMQGWTTINVESTIFANCETFLKDN